MLDIGVGQIAPRFPLKLEENLIQEQNGETYRFKKDSELGWVLWEYHCGEWRRYLSFTTERQYEIDFSPTSFWCEKHPDSPFNKDHMIAIKTADGRRTVDGNVYKEFVGDACVHEEAMDETRTAQVLLDIFGLAAHT
jgi:N-hydroxyarylamine O-acetyltransferase